MTFNSRATGTIEDVQIYDRALSDAEVAGLYATPGSTVANLKSRYKMNEQPSFIGGGVASVPDSAGAFPGSPMATLYTEAGPVP